MIYHAFFFDFVVGSCSTLAPPGYFVAAPAANSPAICAIGTYSTGGASVCSMCTPGYRCPAGSSTPSPPGSECPMGSYCNPSSSLQLCSPGSYGVVTGGISQSQACTPCDPGFYCPASGLIKETRLLCPEGSFCPQGSALPSACPAGTASAALGQASFSSCRLCEMGLFCPAGTAVGQVCPPHHYCPMGTADYTGFPCPPGTYSEVSGLFSPSQCHNCTAGSYCPGNTSPIPCSAGFYNAFARGFSISSCVPCEEGFACPLSGMIQMSVPCDRGHYCPPGTLYPTQFPCPAGRYSDETNLVSQSECLPCPPGYSCALATSSSSISDCVPGSYCPEGTASGHEIPCPMGTFSNLTHLISPQDCFPCTPGSYCLGGSTKVSGPCPPGHYCPPKTTYSMQYPCPAGTYSSSIGLHDSTQCVNCMPGSYCPLAATRMTPCPTGTYSSVYNTQSAAAPAASFCISCPAGNRCISGSVVPVECGLGFYSDSGAGSCLECPRGHYCGSNTTALQLVFSGGQKWSKAGDVAGICFNGTYCANGMTRAPDLLHNGCAAGFYCPAGTDYPIPCPAGTISESPGQDDLSDCRVTEPGFFSLEASTKPTGLCFPGYFCPAGSSSPNQVPCPSRTYRPDLGGTSSSDCSLCVAGGYCPRGSVEPIVCPRGFYCPTGISTPFPCGPGTYGNSSGLRRQEECNACDGGYYCDGFGLTAPRGLCSPGFFCLSGSNTSTPSLLHSLKKGNATDQWSLSFPQYSIASSIGGICPIGSYCPLGSAVPIVSFFLPFFDSILTFFFLSFYYYRRVQKELSIELWGRRRSLIVCPVLLVTSALVLETAHQLANAPLDFTALDIPVFLCNSSLSQAISLSLAQAR